MKVIDYDRIDQWGPKVRGFVNELEGEQLAEDLACSAPEYIEDARDWIFDRIGMDEVIAHLSESLGGFNIRMYHGTRLTDVEVGDVRKHGLKPLNLAERACRVASILENHPRWSDVKDEFPNAIRAFGPEAEAGLREDGSIHACFSRSGLLRGCNHYLATGAEVDNHIGHRLFGDESADRLFRQHRKAYLVSFTLAFDEAAKASHSFEEIEHGREIVIGKLVGAWAYGYAHPKFRLSTQRDGWAARIRGNVAADRLTIEEISDAELEDD